MFPMTPDEYKLLYTDEDGVVVGLDEVQLIDPPYHREGSSIDRFTRFYQPSSSL